MADQLVTLRVKIKSLAAESRIIRHEERRFPSRKQRKVALQCAYAEAGVGRVEIAAIRKGTWPMPNLELPRWYTRNRDNDLYRSLHRHRTLDVRRESRAALLAYAFLRNRKLSTVEPSGKGDGYYPVELVNAIVRVVVKFSGGKVTSAAVEDAQSRLGEWLSEITT